MANPKMVFENFFDDGTLTSSSELAGFPDDNAKDWRLYTQWKPNVLTAGEWLKADLGSGGDLAPDFLIVAGHNLHTIGARVDVEYSDNDIAWTTAATGSVLTTAAPWVDTISESAHRYWRVSVNGGSPPYSTNPALGIVTLGRELEFPWLPANMDIYGKAPVTEWNINNNGSFVGANFRFNRNNLRFDYGAPGAATLDLWAPASGLGWDANAVPHIKQNPWWFLWNTDTDGQDARLLRVVSGHSSPFHETTLRRNLFFEAEELVSQ